MQQQQCSNPIAIRAMRGIGILFLTLGLMAVPAQAAMWNVDADGNWNDSGKWSGGVPNSATAEALVTYDITADRVITLDIAPTIRNLTIGDTAGSPRSGYTISGGLNTLTFSGTGASLTNSASTTNAINANVAVNSALILSVASGSKLTFGGNLSGTGKITTFSPGAVRLEGDNSGFSGGIHVNDNSATRFELLTATALGSGVVTFGNSANGPVFTNASGGALIISTPIGTQSHSTNPRFAGNDMTFSNFSLSSSKSLAHVFYVDGATTLTLPNGIAANSGSRKAGTGNMTITGASAGGLMGWEGGGMLRIGNDLALGNGTTFRAYNGIYIAAGGNRNVPNQTTFGAPGQNLTFDLSNGNNLTFSHASPSIAHDFNIDVTGPGVLTISGNATGLVRPIKTGTGKLILSGDNSGATVASTGVKLSAGTLGLGHNNALGPNDLNVYGNGTLSAENGARVINNLIKMRDFTLTVNTANKLTLNGNISDEQTYQTGKLTLDAGTLVLGGNNNTYKGVTTVNGGTLLVDGLLATQTAAVTVKSGATLGGAGTINRPVLIQNGGAISPGNSPGTLTVSSLTLADNSVYDWELGLGIADLINVTGAGSSLTIGSGLKTLNLSALTSSAVTDTNALMTWAGTDPSGAAALNWTFNLGGRFDPSLSSPQLIFDATNNQLLITGLFAIPESSTLFLLGVGGWVLLQARRRRRRRGVVE